MFKNFEPLNAAVNLAAKTKTAFNVERCLSAGNSILSTAKNLAQKYAMGYSQVQWMKYSSEGEPSDVTPSEQTSAASSIVSAAKSNVKELVNSYNDLDPIHVVRQASSVVMDGIAYGRDTFNYESKLSFVLVNGELRMRVVNSNAYNVKYLITNRLSISSPLTIRNVTQDKQVSFYGNRVTEGVAICSDGSIVRYLVGKTSSAGNGVISVICERNGTFYLFQFADISHTSETEMTAAMNITPSAFDMTIGNPTGLTDFSLFALFMAYGYPIHSGDTITQNQNSSGIAWSNMVSAEARTEVEMDINLQPTDFYENLDKVVQAIENL